MKIDNSIKPAVNLPSSRVKPQQASGNAATSAASDDVKLSAMAGQLQTSDSAPPFDSSRVEEIKRAIAEGRFSINPGAIADRLIDSARELVQQQRRA